MKRFIIGISTLLMLFGGNVLADEIYSSNYQNLTKDGKITIPAEQPKDGMEFQGVFSAFIGSYNTNEYMFFPGEMNDDYTEGDFCLQYEDIEKESECHTVNITYITIDKEIQKKVEELAKNIKNMKFTQDGPVGEIYFMDDMDLINYIVAGYDLNNFNYYATSHLVNYSSDFKKDISNTNLIVSSIPGAGADTPFVKIGFGMGGVWFNGVIYKIYEAIGAEAHTILYVPDDTELTEDALITAAQKRINEYVKGTSFEGKLVLSKGGTLSTTYSADDYETGNFEVRDYDMLDKYYKLTYGDKVYYFMIARSTDKMKNYTYATKDFDTNIEITSDSNLIPIDTTIEVKEEDATSFIKKLGLTDGITYDLKLLSVLNKNYITKKENSKFIVQIPVSEEFEGKTLMAYYIDENGKVEKYAAPVKKGIAAFETGHFSTYTLGYATENPNTSDNVVMYVLLGTISLISIIGLSIYLKKRYN